MIFQDELGSLEIAQRQFRYAHQRAALTSFFTRLLGRCADLCSFEEARRHVRGVVTGQRRLQDICLKQIIGSVGRVHDYTADFMPKLRADESRWVQVNRAINGFGGVPPIEVYQLNGHYFVQDGHHRVSVLRSMGISCTEAYVTEIHTLD
jgi:hypothetical protein